MVDGDFMVDGPSINHGQKAINHKSWLMGRLGEWLMVGPYWCQGPDLPRDDFGTNI